MLSKQISLTLGAILVTVQCLATDEAQQARGQSAQADSSQLGEIIVTAQKRSESILSTAVAVSAVDSEMLRQIAPRTASDIAMVAPALQVNTSNGSSFPIFSLRGVTQNDYSTMASGPIATYVDEVYRSGPAFFSKQIYDLDRIEVLSGPQGTLYGKNATGGAINFVSTKPGFDTSGYVDVTAGNYGEYDTAGAFQTGLTDTLAMRLAFATSHNDGWQKNINPGGQDLGSNRDYGVRLSLLYQADSLEMMLRLATSHVGPSAWAIETQVYPTGIGGGLYGYFHNLYPASNRYTDYFPTFGWHQTAISGAEEREDGASHDVSLSMTWHALSTLDVVSITAFSHGYWNYAEPNATNAPVIPLSDYENASGDQASEDLRVVSHLESSTNYLAGVYLQRDQLLSQFQYGYYPDIDFNGDGKLNYEDCLANLSPTQLLYPYGCIQRNQYRQVRTSIAVYGDGTTHLSPALALQYGLRQTRDTLKASEYTASVYGTDGTPLFNTIPGDPNSVSAVSAPISRTYTKTTGRLGLEYTLPDQTLLYGTVSRGYRGGAVNAAAFNAPAEVTVVSPEVLDAVVVGWKGEYLDKRLQLMSEAFFYSYKGEQALNINPTTFLQTEVSIARSTIKGVDVQVTAKPWSSLTLRLNGSYMHSRIGEGELDGVDIAGNELPYAPTFTVNGNVTWDILTLPAGKLYLFAAERYVARQHFDLLEDPADVLNPYATTDARLNFDFARLPLAISLYGKNLTDKLYYLEKANLESFGYIYEHVGNPRTYGAEFRYKF